MDWRHELRGLFGRLRAVGGGCVHGRSAAVLGCTEHVADENRKVPWGLDAPRPNTKICFWRCLTPELSRTAARHGGMVQPTI